MHQKNVKRAAPGIIEKEGWIMAEPGSLKTPTLVCRAQEARVPMLLLQGLGRAESLDM